MPSFLCYFLQDSSALTTRRAPRRPSRLWTGSRSGWSVSKSSWSAQKTRIGHTKAWPPAPTGKYRNKTSTSVQCYLGAKHFEIIFVGSFLSVLVIQCISILVKSTDISFLILYFWLSIWLIEIKITNATQSFWAVNVLNLKKLSALKVKYLAWNKIHVQN